MGFEFGFGAMPIFVFLFLAIVIVFFIVTIIKGISQWGKNNNSPRLTVEAVVVARRDHVTHHDNHHSTSYYVTFEVESGDRMEFHVPHDEIGYLVEGDHGKLTFQGTRYLGFERC